MAKSTKGKAPRSPRSPTTFKHATREAWLEAAVGGLAEWFAPLAPLPRVRVSTGFPSSWSRTNLNQNKALGQCWGATAAADGVHQVFVTPLLDDAPRVLDVLLHELVHAAVGVDAGHRGAFKRVAVALGLTGPMTATVAGPELRIRLSALALQLGPYPHAALRPKTAKRQTTRLLLVLCRACDYKLRGAKSTLERGIPSCPLCGDEMVLASPPAPTDASSTEAAA